MNFPRLAPGSILTPLLSLGIRVMSVLLGFGIAVYIGRHMGPAANGQYALVTQTAQLMAVIVMGGFDLAIVREYASAKSSGLRIHRADLLKVLAALLAVAAAMVLFVAFAGNWLGKEFADQNLPAGILGLLTTIFITRLISRVQASFLRAQHHFALSQCVEVLLIPLVVLIAIILRFAVSVEEILWWTAAAGMVACVLGLATNLFLSTWEDDAVRRPLSLLFRTAAPLSGVAIVIGFSDWYSLSVVAYFLGVSDAGIYRVAMQIGAMLSIVSVGLSSVFGAKISTAIAAGDEQEVAELCGLAVRLALLLTMPAALALFIGAPYILDAIGESFAGGAVLVRIVAVGQLIIALFGAAGVAMAMAGYGRLNFQITLGGLTTMIVLAPLSAQFFGSVGVTVCVISINILMNGANAWMLYRITGINSVLGRLRAPSARP